MRLTMTARTVDLRRGQRRWHRLGRRHPILWSAWR